MSELEGLDRYPQTIDWRLVTWITYHEFEVPTSYFEHVPTPCSLASGLATFATLAEGTAKARDMMTQVRCSGREARLEHVMLHGLE